MADSFGLKIGVEGDKEFKSSLADIAQNMKVLGSEMALVSSEYDKNDKSAQAVTARNEVLNKQINEQVDKIATLQAALANSADTYGENDKRTQNWQIQLNKAQAELNNMTGELGDSNKALESNSSAVDNTSSKWAGLGSALGTAGKVLGGALLTGMAAIGSGAVAAGKSLYDMSVNTGQLGDTIDEQSKKLGLSTNGYQEWGHVLALNGGNIDSLGAGMKTLTKNLAGADDASKTAQKAFGDIGLKLSDVKGMSPEDTFNLVISKLQDMPEGANKTAASLALLGKQGMELAPILAMSADETEALKQQTHDLGMVLSTEDIAAASKFADSMDNLSGTFSGMKDGIAANFLPGLTDINNGLIGLMTGSQDAGAQLSAGVQAIAGSLNTVLPQITSAISGAVPIITEQAPTIITSLVSAITDNLPALMDGAVSIIQGLLAGIIQALPALVDGGVQIITGLVNGLMAAIPTLMAALPGIITALIDGLMALSGTLADAGIQLLTALLDNLPGIIAAIVAKLPDIILGIVNFLTTAVPQIIDAGVTLITSLIQDLPTIISAIVDKLPEIITGIIGFLTTAIPQLVQAGIDLLVSLVDNLPAIIDAIVKALPEIITAIIEGLVGAIPQLVNAGVELFIALIENLPLIINEIVKAVPDIITAILNGITAALPKIVAAGKELFNSLMTKMPEVLKDIVKAGNDIINGVEGAIKGGFGKIVTAGQDLVKGLWNGIMDMGKWINEKVTGWANGIINTVTGAFGSHSPSTVFAEIGGDLSEGLAIGMEEKAGLVSDANNAMLQNALTDGQKSVDDFEQYLGRDIPIVIAEGIKKNASAAEKEAKAMNDKLLKAQQVAEKERYDSSVKFIEEYRLSDNYIATSEAEMWGTLLDQYSDDQDKRLKIKQEIAKLGTQIDKESFESTKKVLDDAVAAHSISTSEIMLMWDQERQNYAEGTDYRKKVDDEFNKARESAIKEQEGLFKDQEKLLADMEAAEEKYGKAVDDRSKAIYNSFGLFEQLKETEKISTDTLTKNLSDQVQQMKDWAASIDDLAKRGVDEGLIGELRQMGPKAEPEIKALTTMSDDKLTKYVDLWKEKHALARTEAIDELKPLKDETDKQIQALGEQAKASFDKSVIPALKACGEDMADGVIAGFESRQQALMDSISKVMNSVADQANTVNEIKSPSKRYARIGEYLAQGLGEGFTSQMKKLADAITGSFPTAFNVKSDMAGAVNTDSAFNPLNVGNTAGSGNTFVLNVKMDQVDEVYKIKQIFENFAQNKIAAQGV